MILPSRKVSILRGIAATIMGCRDRGHPDDYNVIHDMYFRGDFVDGYDRPMKDEEDDLAEAIIATIYNEGE